MRSNFCSLHAIGCMTFNSEKQHNFSMFMIISIVIRVCCFLSRLNLHLTCAREWLSWISRWCEAVCKASVWTRSWSLNDPMSMQRDLTFSNSKVSCCCCCTHYILFNYRRRDRLVMSFDKCRRQMLSCGFLKLVYDNYLYRLVPSAILPIGEVIAGFFERGQRSHSWWR